MTARLRRRVGGARHAQLPLAVMETEAYRTLSGAAVRVLLALAVQFRGRNNGDLSAALSIMRRYGIGSPARIYAGLDQLIERRLIVRTRQGGLYPHRRCSLYALGWRPIDDCAIELDVAPTRSMASSGWRWWPHGPPLPAARRPDRRSVQRPPTTAPPRLEITS